jgi:hypothetical protein
MCCNGHLELTPLASGRLAVATTCAGQAGTWIYAEILGAGGKPATPPLAVAPARGRSQAIARLAPTVEGGAWIVWAEHDATFHEGATVRAAHLDSADEIDRGPLDLSPDGEALGTALSKSLSVTPLPDGGFAAAWIAHASSGEWLIHLARFDVSGKPSSKTISLHSPRWSNGAGATLRLEADASGRLSVVWQRRGKVADDPDRLAVASVSPKGELLVEPSPVTVDEPRRTQSLGRFVTVGTRRLLVWYEHDPRSGEGWLAFRPWSPERGPIGLTRRVPAALASTWPFLEAVVEGDDALTLYWAPDGPEGLAIPGAVAWRRFTIGEPPRAPSAR